MSHVRLLLLAGLWLGVVPVGQAQPEPLPSGAVARLGSVSFRPGRYVGAVACAPDGKLIASAEHGLVTLWEAGSGRLLRQWQAASVDRLAFTRDSKQLLACGYGDARRYDVATARETRLIEEGPRARWFSVTPDQRRLALADPAEKRVYLWNLETRQELHRWDVPRQVLNVAISTDGERVAAIGYPAGIGHCDMFWLWDATTGKLLHQRQALQPPWCALCFAPQGKALAANTIQGDLLLLDGTTGGETRRFAERWTSGARLEFSPDGRFLAAAGYGGIGVWDVASGKLQSTLRGHSDSVTAVSFGPAGKRLYSAGHVDCSVRCWDVTSGKEVEFGGPSQSPVERLRFRPDGRQLLVEHYDASLHIWDLTTFQEKTDQRIVPQSPTAGFTWQHSAPQLFWTDDRISLGGNTGQRVKHCTAELSRNATRVFQAVGLDDDQRILGVDNLGAVHLWDTQQGKKLRSLTDTIRLSVPVGYAKAHPFAPALAPDGRALLACDAQGDLMLLDLTTDQVRWRWRPARNDLPLYSLALSACNRWALVLNTDSGRVLLDAATGQQLWSQGAPNHWGRRAAFSPDGRMVASDAPYAFTTTNPVHVWETRTGLLRLKLDGHRGHVHDFAFSPDGKRLATGGADTTVLLWDIATAKPSAERKGRLTEPELEKLWRDLGSKDGAAAYQAILKLAASGQAPGYFKKCVQPVTAQYVQRFIEQLADDLRAYRLQAREELTSLGKATTVALTAALADKKLPPEVATAARQLLAESRKAQPLTLWPRHLDQLRAVEVLERDGSTEARAFLRHLAAGLPEAELTQEATVALNRSKKGQAGQPRGAAPQGGQE
jgi:WD40 repeat protein